MDEIWNRHHFLQILILMSNEVQRKEKSLIEEMHLISVLQVLTLVTIYQYYELEHKPNTGRTTNLVHYDNRFLWGLFKGKPLLMKALE